MKTAELESVQLDWAVCKAAGLMDAYPKFKKPATFLKAWQGNSSYYLHPSLDWEHGGPIIERNFISVCMYDGVWIATKSFDPYTGLIGVDYEGSRETPLIAAMRCYVQSKLGDEVEIPQELT